MRLPKLKGFKNRFSVTYQVVNVGQLAELFPEGGAVGVAELVEAGAVRKGQLVKVLGDGDLAGVSLQVTADAFSSAARRSWPRPAAASPPSDAGTWSTPTAVGSDQRQVGTGRLLAVRPLSPVGMPGRTPLTAGGYRLAGAGSPRSRIVRAERDVVRDQGGVVGP